jgi:type I restriction enzyme R subunit
MKPEEKARQKIDQLLEAAGWKIQDLRDLNLGASFGVSVREFPLKSGAADYLNFVDREAVGVVEAKPEGTTLSGVAEQSEKYLTGIPEGLPHVQEPLPFSYESTGTETLFRDTRDPDARSRRVFAFHKPETLKELSLQEETLRARLKKMPSMVPLNKEGLRDCQFEAIQNLERSFAEARPRALIQMATGSGKTYTAVSFIYRLIKFAGAKRVLFLVDRSNLGRQTKKEFQQYVTPDDGRKFTELYNVQHLTSNTIDPVSKVCITTIQRLYSMLRGETEFEPENEEPSLFEISPDGTEKEVYYNPQIPIETFDFIVTDECHRSIYGLWRQVLEYFDAFLIGLTATPSRQTLGFFNQNLVMEYSHERAVADGVNVGYEVYRIKTDISEKGGKVEAGDFVDKRDKLTRKVRWEQLDKSKVRGAGAQKLLTDIISLIRFAAGKNDILEPFPETVNLRFERWRAEQERAGVRFTEAQVEWLLMIKDHIASSLGIEIGDFENVPFNQKGGAVRAYQLFGKGLDNILEELNEVLAV